MKQIQNNVRKPRAYFTDLKKRDRCLKELKRNNIGIRRPKDLFWQTYAEVLERCRNSSYAAFMRELEKDVERKTDFTLVRQKQTSGTPYYDPSIKPYPVPESLPHSPFDIPPFRNESYEIAREANLKSEKAAELYSLQERNVDLLTRLCRMDLEMRIGNSYKGIYPCAGLDSDLTYKLGGRWLLLEQGFSLQEYERRIRQDTRHGAKALDGGRLSLMQTPVQYDNSVARSVKRHSPDVILLKEPGPQVTFEKLATFFSRTLQRETLVLSEKELQVPGFTKLDNILCLDGLDRLYTEIASHEIFPSLMYDFTCFHVYNLRP